MMMLATMKLEERRANSIQVRSFYGCHSYLQPSGRLYLDLGGQFIQTSPVRFVFQESDDSLVFQTRSGTEYVVTFQNQCDYQSEFARSIFHTVMETNVTTLICRPHMVDIFNRLAR